MPCLSCLIMSFFLCDICNLLFILLIDTMVIISVIFKYLLFLFLGNSGVIVYHIKHCMKSCDFLKEQIPLGNRAYFAILPFHCYSNLHLCRWQSIHQITFLREYNVKTNPQFMVSKVEYYLKNRLCHWLINLAYCKIELLSIFKNYIGEIFYRIFLK